MEWDMMDRVDNIMDLDLNLEPLSSPSLVVDPTLGPQSGPPPPPGEALNLEYWVAAGPPLPEPPTIRGRTSRQRYRFRNSRRPVENSIPLHWLVDSEEPVGGPSGAGLAAEDGGGSSIALEGRSEEVGKTCESHVSFCENGSGGEGECAERKTSSEEGSLFDCNICLDSAKEPVVTCCGHLFCWGCIYSWIHIHSHTRECPVCKGEVTDKTLIPIYGRGNHTCKTDEDSGEEIPARPSGNRIENIRQTIQRATSSFTLEEIIHRVGAWFDDIFQPPSNDDGDVALMYSILQRILTRRAQNRPENVVELTQERAETSRQQRLPPLTYRRRQSSVVQSLGQELPPAGDDRDSFSSVAAVIHGETISTSSSSRLRNEAFRTSDGDSSESRALRRRRLA